MISEVYNEDNMVGMARYPDGFFDLAVVDPPYGIDASEMVMGKGKKKWNKGKKWDNLPPSPEYFAELRRVSKHQIVWGGNYFTDNLPVSRCWIFWDKDVPDGFSFADGELAWTSFDMVLQKARIPYSGSRGADRVKIHPTQKPVKLYRFIFDKFSKHGDKILDTHLGSQNSRCAAYEAGLDFYGWENDADYFASGNRNFTEFTSQQTLFPPA